MLAGRMNKSDSKSNAKGVSFDIKQKPVKSGGYQRQLDEEDPGQSQLDLEDTQNPPTSLRGNQEESKDEVPIT